MTLKELLSEHEYAALRGVSIRTIRRERALRNGPAFVKLGKLVYYRPESLDTWILSQEQTPTNGKAA